METTMFSGSHSPLDLAKRVLSSETLENVSRAPFSMQGWKVLDRWALNSPEQLEALERQGLVLLMDRVLQQQRLETEVLTSEAALLALRSGQTEEEVLQANEVTTAL